MINKISCFLGRWKSIRRIFQWIFNYFDMYTIVLTWILESQSGRCYSWKEVKKFIIYLVVLKWCVDLRRDLWGRCYWLCKRRAIRRVGPANQALWAWRRAVDRRCRATGLGFCPLRTYSGNDPSTKSLMGTLPPGSLGPHIPKDRMRLTFYCILFTLSKKRKLQAGCSS